MHSHILPPQVGGHWINFGPLLYHYSDMMGELSVELSYEELKATFGTFGLELVQERLGMPSNYTGHPTSMLRQEYQCAFFTCVKKFHYTPPGTPVATAPASS